MHQNGAAVPSSRGAPGLPRTSAAQRVGFFTLANEGTHVALPCAMNTKTVFSLTLLLGVLAAGPDAVAADEAPSVSLLVEGATIIPVDGTGTYIEAGWLTVGDDGRILALGVGAPPDGLAPHRTLDGRGRIVIPGFLSGHSHLYQSPFRGIGAHETLIGWVGCYHRTYGPRYHPTDLYWYSKHGAMDYLAHGITTIFDWTLNAGWSVDRYVDLFRGSLDSGARVIFGYGADLDRDLAENRRMLAQYLEIIEREGIDASHPRVPAVWMSGLGLLSGEASATMEFTLAREFDLPMQVHYLEEPEPVYTGIQRGLFDVYEKTGVLGPSFNFAHFINTTDEILERTAASGTAMVWNPLSNGRLASGLADIPKYRRYGIAVGMGLDGQASADLSDPFENMRMGMYAIRMKYQAADALMPLDMLRFHTIGTAEIFGIADEVGSLEPGKRADFLVLDLRDPETSPVIHPVEHVVLAASADNIEGIYVGGELVVDRGRFTRVDQDRVAEEISWRLARVRSRIAEDEAAGEIERGPAFKGLKQYQQKSIDPELGHPGYGRPRGSAAP